MKPIPNEMKDDFRKRKECEKIYERIHAQRRTKFPERKRDTYVLPEGYTGAEWKRALKLIKGRKLKKRKGNRK